MKHSASYGPDKLLVAFWALLCSPPALLFGFLLAKSPNADMAAPFEFALVLPVITVIFASRFRATFAATEFVYRRWGPTIRVSYSQIASVEVANVTPITKQPIGAFVVTSGGERLPLWPKLFPREAVNRFFALGG